MTIIETDSYVVGQESYRTDVKVTNTGSGAHDLILYRAADCYLQNSDTGFGRVDTSTGAVSSPGLPLPQHRYRHPEDALEQLTRGLDLHEKVFGLRPKGVWPSEGSVSEEVLAIAHSLGIQWMATDEGVLGRSTGTFFARDGNGRFSRNWNPAKTYYEPVYGMVPSDSL